MLQVIVCGTGRLHLAYDSLYMCSHWIRPRRKYGCLQVNTTNGARSIYE
jgi:hypothetical protein